MENPDCKQSPSADVGSFHDEVVGVFVIVAVSVVAGEM